MRRSAVHNAARGIRKAPPAYASVHRSYNQNERPSPGPSLADKSRQKTIFAAVAHLLCKTIPPLPSVTFIARTLGNEIPCGFADHQRIEGLPIVRFIGTKVADLFSSTFLMCNFVPPVVSPCTTRPSFWHCQMWSVSAGPGWYRPMRWNEATGPG